MGRYHYRWLTAALGLLAISMLLAGCGSTAEDPFVGTWRDAGGRIFAVISRPATGYRIYTRIFDFQGVTRSGDELRATQTLHFPDPPKERTMQMVFAYGPGSGRLIVTEVEAPGVRIELSRDSTSTAVPSLWPSAD
jgi:hypothetical protein